MTNGVTGARRGFFLTLEGGEGAGKSTQARRLSTALQSRGLKTLLTREPGGSPGAEQIRSLLVQGDAARWTPLTEALLMNASRADHIERTILPALEAGRIVICDRFADSTEAYQGAGGGVSPADVATLRRMVVGPHEPDLTLIFDLPVDTGLARAGARGGDARFESKGAAYHRRLRQAYLAIADRDPARCKLIDAARSEEEVATQILQIVEAQLLSRGLLA